MTDVDIPTVIATGDRPASLRALRDRLAQELDEGVVAQHRRECSCVCGIADLRAMVALIKELRAVIAELDGLPAAEEGSPLDDIAARVADEVGQRRTRRLAVAEGS